MSTKNQHSRARGGPRWNKSRLGTQSTDEVQSVARKQENSDGLGESGKGNIQKHVPTVAEKQKAGSTHGHFPGKSGHIGVVADRHRWQARTRKDGKQHYLGTFDTIKEAADAIRVYEDAVAAAATAAAEAAEAVVKQGEDQSKYSPNTMKLIEFTSNDDASLVDSPSSSDQSSSNNSNFSSVSSDSAKWTNKTTTKTKTKRKEQMKKKANVSDPKSQQPQPPPPPQIRGVVLNGRMWQAQVNVGGKHVHLGRFETQANAVAAVERYEKTGVRSLSGHKPGKSGVRGVVAEGKKWKARAVDRGRQRHLGMFNTIKEAAEAVRLFEEVLKAQNSPVSTSSSTAARASARASAGSSSRVRDSLRPNVIAPDRGSEAKAGPGSETRMDTMKSSSTLSPHAVPTRPSRSTRKRGREDSIIDDHIDIVATLTGLKSARVSPPERK